MGVALPEGYKDSPLGLIPVEWSFDTLGKAGVVIMGQSPKGESYNSDGDGVPLLNGPTEFTDWHPVKIQWTTAPTKFCEDGDILLCVRGSSTGRMNIANDEYCIGRGLAAIRKGEANNQSFLIYVLQYLIDEILKFTSGTTFPNLDGKTLQSLLIPEPPLPEQKKIAQILSTVDSKLALIDQQITATRTLKKGLMQKLFSEGVGTQDGASGDSGQWQPHTEFKDSELGRIPVGWEVTKLVKLIEKLESGVSVNGEDRLKKLGEVAVLKISSVTYGIFNPLQHKVIIEKDIPRAKLNPQKDQILVSRSNTESLVGASVYVEDDYPNLFLPDKLWQTVPFENAPLVMRWLSYVLASTEMREIISGMATGTSGSMKNITKGEFLGISLALPPVAEQKKIAKILSTVDRKMDHLTTQKTQTQQLKKGLMQKLLTGQIRVKPEPQDH